MAQAQFIKKKLKRRYVAFRNKNMDGRTTGEGSTLRKKKFVTVSL
jgi:hypothetical protein